MGRRIGVVTIGQSPRPDGLAVEMAQVLGSGFELAEAGALDGLSRAEIEALAPTPGDYVLTSILRDGSSVRFAKKHILPRLQDSIDHMNEWGMDVILLACAGTFPQFHTRVPVVEPGPALTNLVKGIAGELRVGVVTPLPEQMEQEMAKWDDVGLDVVMTHGDPYGDPLLIEQASTELVAAGVDLVVLECFGHTLSMKEKVKQMTGKPVVLVRSAMARVLAEVA